MRKIGIMSLGELVPEPSVTGPAAEAAAGLATHAMDVANFLKALGHDGRLMILCHLLSGPKSVTELETLLSSRQAAVSQQLARLRLEGLVSASGRVRRSFTRSAISALPISCAFWLAFGAVTRKSDSVRTTGRGTGG